MDAKSKRVIRSTSRLLLCILFTFHAIAITLTNFPEGSVREYFGWKTHFVIRKYLSTVGAWQVWHMFIGKPNVHSFKVNVLIVPDEGPKRIIDPILPGFKPVGRSQRRNLFFYYKKPHIERLYLRKMCKALKETPEFTPPATLSMVKEQEITRSLKAIRKTRDMFFKLVDKGEVKYRCR